jgi:hypothetical protein
LWISFCVVNGFWANPPPKRWRPEIRPQRCSSVQTLQLLVTLASSTRK